MGDRRLLCGGILGEAVEDGVGVVEMVGEVKVRDDGNDERVVEPGAEFVLPMSSARRSWHCAWEGQRLAAYEECCCEGVHVTTCGGRIAHGAASSLVGQGARRGTFTVEGYLYIAGPFGWALGLQGWHCG